MSADDVIDASNYKLPGSTRVIAGTAAVPTSP